MKHRLYRLLEPGAHRDRLRQKLVDGLILTLILLSVTAVVLLTDRTIAAGIGPYLHGIQWFATVVFTVEYVLRVYVCTVDPRYSHPFTGRLRFMVSPMAVIDLLAILPFVVVALFAPGSDFAGAMLMLRMLRLLKLFRYSRSLMVFAQVLRDKADQLLAGVLMTAVLLVLASSLVFFAERGAQPQAFESIPQTMWWGIITLTTVGYGDMSPVTPLGQLFGAVTAVIGIGLVALPSGILASGFIEAFESQSRARKRPVAEPAGPAPEDASTCPSCGQALPDGQDGSRPYSSS